MKFKCHYILRKMKKYILLSLSLLLLFSCSQSKQLPKTGSTTTEKFKVEGKEVIVYTTADSTNYRLKLTDTLKFKELIQPKETQICVFTDPDKNLMFTEGCPESFNASMYNYWGLGEEYGRSMINDFNNGTVGWTDWNIFLSLFVRVQNG